MIKINFRKLTPILFTLIIGVLLVGCEKPNMKKTIEVVPMTENQLTFSPKTHSLDNNDNFSPDGKYLCYDTRATVYNENLANCKSIEKVNIETGEETILWKPESITGENAAPGVAAVSYHPNENKVIFIHGPFLDEVDERGYYSIRNRSGFEIDGEAVDGTVRVDMRDITNDVTTPGAHRGGTHRHEYSKSGNRIGFTYDDIIIQNIGRTIGYMEVNKSVPKGYTHYFSVILKPAEESKSKPGEIEKAWDDSWVDSLGTMRAFVGKVRAENGSDYYNDIFIADIPLDVDITTSFSGNREEYPRPPKGIKIRRLTKGLNSDGVIRSTENGKRIVFRAEDSNGILQLYIIKVDGSQKLPTKITDFSKDASAVRWHPSGNWLFCISDGHIMATHLDKNKTIAKSFRLTEKNMSRDDLVVSKDGKIIAFDAPTVTRDKDTKLVKDATGEDFRQIYLIKIDWNKLTSYLR